jgi:hypothetical protein
MMKMDTSSTVELLCLTQRAPLLLRGTFEQTTEQYWIFQSHQPVLFDITGLRAIISFPESQKPMLTLRIEAQQGELIELSPIGEHPREQRQYPRLFTPIHMRFAPLSDGTSEQWMNREINVQDDWQQPEPFMNFSVNGVGFEWTEPLEHNCKLMVAIYSNDTEFRGIARVVRCTPNEDTDQYSIALYFEALEASGIDYLSELTLKLQDDLL